MAASLPRSARQFQQQQLAWLRPPCETRGELSRAGCSACDQTHTMEFVDDMLMVGGRPIDAPAAGASDEAFLRRQHVGRNPCCRFFLGDWGYRYVAAYAARERTSGGSQIEQLHDLLELLAKVVAADEDDGDGRWSAQEAAITRQDDTSFGPSVAQERAPAEMCAVRRILPDQAQPCGQPTEHSVYGKSQRIHRPVREYWR
jgi:hypothetical protein